MKLWLRRKFGSTSGLWKPKRPTPACRGDNPYYLGQHNDTDYYFYYEPQTVTVLDYAFSPPFSEKASGTVIYADLCSIGEDKLAQMGITYKKTPGILAGYKKVMLHGNERLSEKGDCGLSPLSGTVE